MENLKTIILPVLLLICVNSVSAQRLVRYTETINISINLVSSVGGISYNADIPKNIPGRQQVLSIDFKSKEPQKTFTKNKKSYAFFTFFEPKSVEKIEIEAILLLNDNDLVNAKKNKKKPEIINAKKYLKQQLNFQVKNKKIKAVAESIAGKTDEEIARNIYQYVIDQLEYKIFKQQNRGAKKALLTKQGDCTEYSELMVTLCRAKGIPAKIVTGVVISNAANPRHNWVEIYLKEYGWVSVDPTHGDHENAITTFENLQNKYIHFNYSRFKNGGVRWTQQETVSSQKAVKLKTSFSFEDLGLMNLTKAIKLYQAGSYEESQQIIENILALGAMDVHYFVLRGLLFTKLADKEEGLANLQIAMRLAENQYDRDVVFLAFGNYYNLIGAKEEAANILKRTFSKNGKISSKGIYIWDELKKSNPTIIHSVFSN